MGSWLSGITGTMGQTGNDLASALQARRKQRIDDVAQMLNFIKAGASVQELQQRISEEKQRQKLMTAPVPEGTLARPTGETFGLTWNPQKGSFETQQLLPAFTTSEETKKRLQAAVTAMPKPIQDMVQPVVDDYLSRGEFDKATQYVGMITGKDVSDVLHPKPWTLNHIGENVIGLTAPDGTQIINPDDPRLPDDQRKFLLEARKISADAEQRKVQLRAAEAAITDDYIKAREGRKAMGNGMTMLITNRGRLKAMQDTLADIKLHPEHAAQGDVLILGAHVFMTQNVGQMKGYRPTRAMWEEAQKNRPYYQGIETKFTGALMTGATLSPEQREQMVELAREFVETAAMQVGDTADTFGVKLSDAQRALLNDPLKGLEAHAPSIPPPPGYVLDKK